MNLFISDNFIDTIGHRVNILQVIRQVAEEDDLIQAEILNELCEILDYSTAASLQDSITENEFEDLALSDDVLYIGGELLKDIFEALFPGDHTTVISALVESIGQADQPLIKLTHNCVPDQSVEVQEVQELQLNFPNIPAMNERHVDLSAPAQPFQASEEVLRTEVAVLSSDLILGNLSFNGHNVGVAYPAGKNGVVFDVQSLYYAVYGLEIDPRYLAQILIENRTSIDPEDLHMVGHTINLTAYGLAKVHSRLSHLVEWYPLVTQVVTDFCNNPHSDLTLNLLGNPEG